MSERGIPEVFGRAINMMLSLGFKDIQALEGCAEHQIDADWFVALNGHSEAIKCSKGPEVPPFHLYVEYKGWPAGIIGVDDGIIAGGESANEEILLEAIDRAYPRLQASKARK